MKTLVEGLAASDIGHLLLPSLNSLETVVQRKEHQYCLETGEADL